jgi:hypothetical protein
VLLPSDTYKKPITSVTAVLLPFVNFDVNVVPGSELFAILRPIYTVNKFRSERLGTISVGQRCN